jgi:hypothetical protein
VDNPTIETNIGYLELLSEIDLTRNNTGKISEAIRSNKSLVPLDRLVEMHLRNYGKTVKDGEVRESRVRMKGQRVPDVVIYRERFGPGGELGYFCSSVHYGPISLDETRQIFP